MAYTIQQLNDIYDFNYGYCYHCDMKLAFRNYGKVGQKAAWEVDHYMPRSLGGAHHPSNWVPACVHCNTVKSNKHPDDFDPFEC